MKQIPAEQGWEGATKKQMAVNAKPTTADSFIQIPKKKEGRKPIQKVSVLEAGFPSSKN